MIIKSISDVGICIVAEQCLPMINSKISRTSIIREMQIDWFNRHTNLFLSNNRLYVKIGLHRHEGVYIMDAITGTLYHGNGLPMVEDCTLAVSLKKIITNRDKIMQFPKSKYGML